ncbi:MAG: MOSC domain-containing protein [Bacteroidia bacterium]
MSKISHLYRYPLKSCKGESIQKAEIELYGFKGDRTFALLGKDGHLITSRTYPKLLLLKAKDLGDYFEVELLNGKKHQFKLDLKKNTEATHFSATFNVQTVSFEADSWFSAYLEIPCQLVINHSEKSRLIKPKYSSDGRSLKMTDASPILLINQASIDELNSRLDQNIDHRNFRPNIVVNQEYAYDEHQWNSLQIGNMHFVKMSDCKRCRLTTVNPDTGDFNSEGEPLKSLSKYRTAEDGMVIFGIYLLPTSSGIISLDDQFKVLD